jgi:hypothetical protein
VQCVRAGLVELRLLARVPLCTDRPRASFSSPGATYGALTL